MQDGALASQALGVVTGAQANAVVERRGRQAVQDQGGGGGVADAHLADRQKLGVAGLGEARAGLECLVQLGSRHGGFERGVGRSAGDIVGDQVGVLGELGGDARIDNRYVAAHGASEGVGAGLARQEGRDHGGGDVGRIGRDGGLVEPMVAGEDQQAGAIAARIWPAGDQGEAHGEVLDAAQGAGRLGLAVDQGAELGLAGAVEGGDHAASRPAMAASAGMSKLSARDLAMRSRAASTRAA